MSRIHLKQLDCASIIFRIIGGSKNHRIMGRIFRTIGDFFMLYHISSPG